MRTCFCLSAFLCVRESLCWGEAEAELCPAGGEASDFHRGLRLGASPCGRGGLWPPTIWLAYAAYIRLCCLYSPLCPSLSLLSSPLPLFALLSPPSLPLSLWPPTLLAYVALRLQRGIASDRPLATTWYRSAAFLATCGIRIDHYAYATLNERSPY